MIKCPITLAGTYDAKSGEARIYIDDVLDGEGKIGREIVPNTDVLWLGHGAGTSGRTHGRSSNF